MVVLIFIFGSIVGSFLNVVLLRKNTGESVAKDGSRCFSCGRKLKARDLIPILSFFWRRGKCGYCGSKISLQYPIVEFVAGGLALAIYLKVGLVLPWTYYFTAFSLFFLIAAYDFKNKIIDAQFIYAFSFFAVIEFLARKNFADDLTSSFFIALFFYFLWLFSRGSWMGRGDADLAFWAALFLGFPLNLVMLFSAFWLGGIVGAALLLSKSRFGLKSEIPFAPFLAGAAFAVWLFQDFFRTFYGIIF